MIIARTKMKIGLEVAFFATDDQKNFAMGFEPYQTVDHVDSGFFHFTGPSDVIGLIKTGFEFDKNSHLLVVVCGSDEGVEHRGITTRAVKGHLDSKNVGIDGRLFEDGDDGLKAFVWVMKEDVVLSDGLEVVRGKTEGRGNGWIEKWVMKIRMTPSSLRQSEELGEVDRTRYPIDVFRRQVKMGEQIRFNFRRAILRQFKPHGSSPVSFLEFFLNG